MATYNFNIKITTGKRTKLSVHVESTLVNDKLIEFEDSEYSITASELARSLKKDIETGILMSFNDI